MADYSNPGLNDPGASSGGTDWASLLGSPSFGQIGGGLINYLTAGNAAGQLSRGIGNVIPQQAGVLGNINTLYGPQRGLGNAAMGGLGSFLGLPGSKPFDPSTLNNFPGLNFLEKTGDTAIRNQASAKGTEYTPGTMAYLSQFNQGTALNNAIQPYLSTLLQSAGFGSQANQALTGANLTTGNNVAQAFIGQGAANASGTAAQATPLNSLFQGGTGLLKNFLGNGFSADASAVNPASAALGGDITNAGADTAYDLGTQYADIFGPSTAGGEAAGTAAGTGAEVASGAEATSAAGDAGAGAGIGLGLGAGAGALAGFYGMYALDQANSHYNPLDAYGDLMTSASGLDPSQAAAYRTIANLELNNPGNTGLFGAAGPSPTKVSGKQK